MSVAAGLLMSCLGSSAATLQVCGDCRYTSVEKAIEAAVEGDTILVREGTYKENTLLIDKTMVLRGSGKAVIESAEGKSLLLVQADNVVIEGLIIQGVLTSYIEDRSGIRIRNSSDFTIRNCTLKNTFFGIYLEHSNNGLVEGNMVLGEAEEEMSSGNAMHLWHCKNITIKDNLFIRHRDGIYLEFVDSSRIYGNASKENLRYGLHFMFSNDDDYYNNLFRDNGAGVAVMFSRRINMKHNSFEHNWGRASYGLLLKEIYDARIEENNFLHNTVGIQVEGSTRIQYLHNDFSGNGWAVKMMGGTQDNLFKSNNFLSNSLDFVINGRGSGLLIEHNYWSEYSGYDLDHNGEGDVPHRPVKLYGFILEQSPESIVLLRSMFIELVNFSEKVSPVFTPVNITDDHPQMRRNEHILPVLNDFSDLKAKYN